MTTDSALAQLIDIDLTNLVFSPVFFEATYAVRASLHLWESGLPAMNDYAVCLGTALPASRASLAPTGAVPDTDPTFTAPSVTNFSARVEKLIERSIGQSEKE
ncbi:hypothetical protein BK655_10895 [Pseudomonas brassicacearum]|uniref:hypothetical protein n=1 Tax=Pseudomonas brassicacearum TaxID=930166 RepID=UPI000F49B086|nr:hypothetical protein [Pseudomonas brassicacearum]ROM85572.1 hypothetical protein BK655_10895 [Pseudomonas brassicacearum]